MSDAILGLRRETAPGDYREQALLVLMLLACVSGYALALGGPFFFDDIPNLLDNPLMQIDGREFDDWRVAIISNDAGLFHRPIAMASFTLNYVLTGTFSPLVFKGTNLLIHMLIGVLLYYLCRALLRTPAMAASGLAGKPVALVAAALWLLHPLQVSTVLYVVQRMAQLSTLFTVLGLLVFCRYRLRWAQDGASLGELIAAALWLALITVAALLSKENGALLLWLIVVIEVVLFRGVWVGRPRALLARLGWLTLLLPVLLVVGVLLVAPEWIAGRYGGREFTLEERLLTQGRLLWQYLSWILLPNITSMGFFHDDIPLSKDLFSPATTALSLLAWLVISIIALQLRNRYPLLLFGLLFYLVGHAMESTVIALEMVFEHRNYLPSMGICLLVSAGLFQAGARLKLLRLRVFLTIVFTVLLVQLFLRTQAWTDEPGLAQFNVINHPDSPRANFYYGSTLFTRFSRAPELDLDDEESKALAVAARTHFLRMHELAPRSFPALVMLYQLDTVNFPRLAQENDWLGKLEVLAREKRLHASDRTALSALVRFAQSPVGENDRARVQSLLDQLVLRYPSRVDLVAFQYKLMATAPGANREQLREHLLSAIRAHPGNRMLYAYLIQNHGTEDVSVTHEAIRAWMKMDTRRRELSIIRRMFES